MNTVAEAVTADQDDTYAWWQAKLTGAGEVDPRNDRTKMPPGFWRTKAGDPLAVWIGAEGERVALLGFELNARRVPTRRMEEMAEFWGFERAVAESAYRAAFAAGRWPDTDQVVAEQTTLRAPGIGHNDPPDEAELLKEQIDAAAAGADDYKTIVDDETAARAQSLRSRLLELSGAADKKREAEKRPHLEAGKAIDAKWQPLVKTAKAVADTLRAALSRFETEKAHKAAEEERARQKAEQAAAEAARKASGATAPAPPPEPPQPAAITTEKTQVRGGYGRPGVVTTVTVVTGFADQDATYQHFRTNPEVPALLSKLAQRAVDAGITVPGVIVEQQRQVR